MAVVCEGQKAYGKDVNLQSILAYFTMKFERKYSVQQIIYALDRYTDDHNDIPTPADINRILNPLPPRVTTSQYIAAQDWQKRNGYPMFSEALDTIKAFEAQEKEDRLGFDEDVKKIASMAQKQIGSAS